MKRVLVSTFIVICILFALLQIFSPVASMFLEKGLEKYFPGAKISVEGIKAVPFSSVTITGIDIGKKGEYSYSVKEAVIYFSISSLLRKSIKKLEVTEIGVDINGDDKSFSDIFPPLSGSAGYNPGYSFTVDEVDMYRTHFNVDLKDLNIKNAVLSASLHLSDPDLTSFYLKIPSMEKGDISVKEVVMTVPPGMERGRFNCGLLKFNEFEIDNIDSVMVTGPGKVSLYSIDADLFSGKIGGEIDLEFNKGIVYDLIIGIKDIGLSAVIKTFKWDNKLTLSGFMNGIIELKGMNEDVNMLEGNFDMEKGGTLKITDEEFLKRIAASTGQPVDLIKASFEVYSYTTGKLTVRMYKDDIMMNMSLGGNDGKRDLTVTLHDFQI